MTYAAGMKMALALLVMLFALLSDTARAGTGEALSYRCDEFVVVGRLKNLRYEHVEVEDDLLAMAGSLRIWRSKRPSLGSKARQFYEFDTSLIHTCGATAVFYLSCSAPGMFTPSLLLV